LGDLHRKVHENVVAIDCSVIGNTVVWTKFSKKWWFLPLGKA